MLKTYAFSLVILIVAVGALSGCAKSVSGSHKSAKINRIVTVHARGFTDLSDKNTLYAAEFADLRHDYATELKLYRPFAERGNLDAQKAMAEMYYEGKGVTTDYAVAAKWYQKAADQGDPYAETKLGYMSNLGRGVPEDHVKGFVWLHKAAKQGDDTAQAELGIMYFLGQGVLQDYVRAYMWLNLSAAQGNPISVNARNRFVSQMTPEQIARAQDMAHRCEASHYKDCD